MNTENIVLTYLLIGIVVALINGAVRKIEADALLGFAWILVWPLTPIGLITTYVIHVIKAVKAYQPCRRTKIYFLKKF